MKIAVAWAIAAVAGLVLLSACGGGGGEGAPPPAQETPTPEVTAEAIAEVEEEEAPDRSDVSFVDNLLAKVEAGEWTLGEGLVATLRLFAGELDAASVLRHPDLINYEGTGVLKMAYEYLDDGPDAEAKAEIARLLDLLVFSNDQLEAMAGLGPPTAGHPGQLALGAARGPVEDCLEFFHGEVPAGVGQCLEVGLSDLLEDLYTGEYRIFFPAPSLPAAGWTEKHYQLALEAMEKTVPVYKELGKMSPVNLVFSVSEDPVLAAQAFPRVGKPCGVAVYTSMKAEPPGDFKQVIAHELAHCFQTATFPEQDQPPYEVIRWRDEGLAEYLSNVAYPTNNLEWDLLKYLAFVELKTTLFDRSYENFLFFQYLQNIVGNDGIFDLVRSLPTDAAHGRPEQEAALAQYPGIYEIYHDFARAMTDEQIVDTGGGFIPYEAESPTVGITAPATPLVQRKVKPFGVVRRLLVVEEDKQAALEFNGKGLIRESARPSNEMEWSEVPSELPDEDCNTGIILVVTNTEPDGGFELDVPVVLQVAGSGSLEGEWVIDNDSMKDRISYTFPQQTVDSYGGEIRANFRDDGKVEVVYDGFEVSGHSDVSGFGEAELHTELTMTTNARGVDSYEVKGEYIFYGSLFEEDFLEGTETIKSVQKGFMFKAEGYQVPVDEESVTTETESLGWGLFGAAQKYDLQCNGTILRFLGGPSDEVTAILHRVGFAD